MKTKIKQTVLAGIAAFAMIAAAAPAMADNQERGNLPPSDSMFWEVFSQMTTPDDTAGCRSGVNNYISSHPEEFGGPDTEQMRSEMSQMCTEIATMPDDMQSGMASDGVETNLFDDSNTNWHAISGLYFQKIGDGRPIGRISFSETIDFMSYRFFNFMNHFENMVQFDGGYISLNAAMVPDMINYGATLTMYQLGFDQQPDIYVSNGAKMRKAAEGRDFTNLTWNAGANSLTFAPVHFSSFEAVQQGSKVKKMKISSVKKKRIKFSTKKRTFRLTVKGKHLYKHGSDTSCMLGFQEAEKIQVGKGGKRVKCTFGMASFSALGDFPLTISIPGQGEVTRVNAVKIR